MLTQCLEELNFADNQKKKKKKKRIYVIQQTNMIVQFTDQLRTNRCHGHTVQNKLNKQTEHITLDLQQC